MSGFNSRCGTSISIITSHPGQLSWAIPSWVDTMSTSQRAVTPCGWGVKAGIRFVCGWQVKLCDPIVTHGPSERFRGVAYDITKRYSRYCTGLQARMQRGVTGVVTPLNLSEVKFSGSTFGSCTTADSTVFKFCTSMWLFSALAPALYKGCGLLAAIIFFSVKLIWH